MTATFLVGDVRERQAELIAAGERFDFVLCSPPFLALRSYLPPDHPDKGKEIGSEATPAEFLDVLLELTEQWGRLLAPHGSLAVELGDTYAGSGGGGGDYQAEGLRAGQPVFDGSGRRIRETRREGYIANGVQPPARRDLSEGWPLDKSLACIPQLYQVALAYGINPLTGRESPAGRWRVRNLKPWIRSNPPVGALGDKERPATSYVIVACRARDRWFDLDAVRTGHSEPGASRQLGSRKSDNGGDWTREAASGQNAAGAPPRDWYHTIDAILDAELTLRRQSPPTHARTKGTQDRSGKSADRGGNWASLPEVEQLDSDNTTGAQGVHLRRVLERAGILTTLDALDVSPKGYSGAHYAVWPPELVRLLVDEMCARRVCTVCGEPSRRLVTPTEYVEAPNRPLRDDEARRYGSIDGKRRNDHRATSRQTVGWSECDCEIVGPGSSRPEAVCSTGSQGSTPGPTSKWRPGRILDPFVGSGTTLAVASGMGRDATGIDIDERNADLAYERVGMFLTVDHPIREATA